MHSISELPPEFEPVLRYRMTDDGPKGVEVLNETLWRCDGAVYVRTTNDGEIAYVGKSDGRLCTRLTAHLRGMSLSDLSRNPMASEYRKWAAGKTITIYAHQPPPIEVCGHQVRVHAGLEAALIEAFRPHFVKRK